MYCSSCGIEIPQWSQFCAQCGRPVTVTPPVAESGWPVPPAGRISYPPSLGLPLAKTSGYFVASLVLGIASLIMYPLGVVLGGLAITFYAVGLHQSRANPYLQGKGMGIAGLVTGIVGAVFSIFFIFAMIVSGLAYH
jgi:hypothetical protein